MRIKFRHNILIFIINIFFFIFFLPEIGIGAEVFLKPMSLRNGIESQLSLRWPLKDKNIIFSSKYYNADKKFAQKVGIDLSKCLNKPAVAGYSSDTNKFFMLFYNMAEVEGCNKEYLIQRVKLKKISYNKEGEITDYNEKYLVEVSKTKNHLMKRSDRHIKLYSLNNSYKRRVFAEVEIGCGTIPDITTTDTWPFKKNKLYKLVQDYSYDEGLYNRIVFECSRKYTYDFYFSKNGNSSISWPYFISN